MPILAGNQGLWGMVLALLCGGLPAGLRLQSLGGDRSRGDRAQNGDGSVSGCCTRLVADLLAVGQLTAFAMALFGLVRAPVVTALVLAPLLAATHLVFLADHVLWRHLRLRLGWHFLSYLRCLHLFTGSIARTGIRVWHLALGTAAYLALLAFALAGVLARFDPAPSPVVWASVAVSVALFGNLAAWRSPRRCAPALRNPLWYLEQQALRWLLGQRRAVAAFPPDFLRASFPEEVFAPGPSDTPLLRTTEGYVGARQFELELGADRPHVVLLFLESFCASQVGVLGGSAQASPEFDRLSRQGVLFRQCYGNGVQTARAVIAGLFGIPPRFSEQPVQADLRRCPRLRGLPQFFGEMDYVNAYFHNGSLAFERQDAFFPRQGFQQVHGYQEIRNRYPDAKILGGWGVPDEFLMRYFAEWLTQREAEGRPTFSTLFTMTNHHPFVVPEGFPLPPYACPGSPEKEMFLRTFYYTDHCLGMLMRLLQDRGLDRKSLIVVLADTAQPLGERGNWTEQNGLFEENLRIPLLILAPNRLRSPGVVDAPCSQLDLLPTFIDLFQRPFRHHALGTSLARVTGERAIWFNTPFGTRAVGMRRGRFKVIHEFATEVTSLYDLVRDPHELHNLAEAQAPLAEALKRELLTSHAAVQALYLRDRFC